MVRSKVKPDLEKFIVRGVWVEKDKAEVKVFSLKEYCYELQILTGISGKWFNRAVQNLMEAEK